MSIKYKFGLYMNAAVRPNAYGGPKVDIAMGLCRLDATVKGLPKNRFYADKLASLEIQFFGFDVYATPSERYMRDGIDPQVLPAHSFLGMSQSDLEILPKLFWDASNRMEVSCYNLGSTGAPEALQLVCKAQEFAYDSYYQQIYSDDRLKLLRDDNVSSHSIGYFARFMLGMNRLGVKVIDTESYLNEVFIAPQQWNAAEIVGMWKMSTTLRELAVQKAAAPMTVAQNAR